MDNLTPAQRRKCMASVRTRATSLEIAIEHQLKKLRIRYETNAKDLPGKPDFVFRHARLVVFIDGNFWHGYRFPQWSKSVSPFWQEKIAKNRKRDQRNFRRLRRDGWTVIRLWQHQVQRSADECASKIHRQLKQNASLERHRRPTLRTR